MNKRIVISWSVFFLLFALVLLFVAGRYSEPREVVLSAEQAKHLGERIWKNEGAGKDENLVVWNEGEAFPSLGIGHFIWYPAGVTHTYQESFPQLLDFISSRQPLPEWLSVHEFAPWQSRKVFLQEKNGALVSRLKLFLKDTMALQSQFIARRLEAALPEILKSIDNPFMRRHVRENFYHVAMQPSGVYALVDYVNFKGEGILEAERYKQAGWGLSQVLQGMNGKRSDVMQDFVDAADFVLSRRVANAPRDESRWLPGWRKRLQTYLVDE